MKKGLIVLFIVIITGLSFAFSLGERTLRPHIQCTEKYCAGKFCCNTCRFYGWGYSHEGRNFEALGPLPECRPDGCGNCGFIILAFGSEINLKIPGFDIRRFLVLTHRRIDNRKNRRVIP